MNSLEIRIYVREDGRSPFQDWFDALKDTRAKTVLTARIARAAGGNFGDWKPIVGGAGLCELRVHYGQGFRVFYAIKESTIVLLLAGATKQEQDRAIAKSKEYLADYDRRIRQ